MSKTLHFLTELSAQHGDDIAMQDGGVEVSYTELCTAVRALAVALQMKNPTPGSRVALCAVNSLEYLVSVLAIEAAGKLLLPLDPLASLDTLHALLKAGQTDVVIVDEAGERRLSLDDEYKITFAQFPGLVHTYRDHVLEDMPSV